MEASSQYHESLLHWLWKNRYLKNKNLVTPTGQNVHVHHPGYANATDGPDFTNARITIGNLMWHGDVEIHWAANDWFTHGHHTDKNFNRVILHVVYDDSKPVEAHRLDETVLPTLHLKPFLSKSLQYFFRRFQQADRLPCSATLSSIAPQILEEQFLKAHNEYFEQKVNDLLTFYDPALPLSRAWQHALIIAIFDNLGISNNREPMQKLARYLLAKYEDISSRQALIKMALCITGIEPNNKNAHFRWKRKGSRPANHPKVRIRQACEIVWFIKNRPFKWWLRTNIEGSFNTMIQAIGTKPAMGSHQSGILFGTVWLPAFYLLGELTGTKKLALNAKDIWIKHRTRLPGSITKPFYQARMPASVFENKLGAVHQLRAYCQPRKCGDCKVFKSAISS